MSKINNYEDLILERKRLESELAHYKSDHYKGTG